MKNILWYLGFISILSILYLIKNDPGFLLFLSFAMFFFTYFAKTDERINQNIGRAARNAFIYTMLSSTLSILYINLTEKISFYQWAFAIVITGALVICVLSFIYYDNKGGIK